MFWEFGEGSYLSAGDADSSFLSLIVWAVFSFIKMNVRVGYNDYVSICMYWFTFLSYQSPDQV